MVTNQYQTINIIYVPQKENRYRLFADFFRFCGFFVVENNASEALLDCLNISCCDTNVYTDGTDVQNPRNPNIIIDTSLYGDDLEAQQTLLTSVIQKTPFDQCSKDALMIIAVIFAKNNLLSAMNTINVYYKVMDLIDNAFESFCSAYVMLSDHMELENKYIDYARLNCTRLANEICFLQSWPMKFLTDAILQLADDLVKKYPDFTSVYVLQAFIADTDSQYQKSAEQFYRKALMLMNDQPYSSYIYYRLGRNYEKFHKDMDTAVVCYKKAFDVNEKNYKACYKLGLYWKNRDTGKAVTYLENILDILNKRYGSDMLHSTGYEYLYKARMKLGEILQKTDVYKAIKNYNVVLEMMDHMTALKNTGNKCLYKELYGSLSHRYMEESLKRMSKLCVQMNLYNCYMEIQDEENAKHCWKSAGAL